VNLGSAKARHHAKCKSIEKAFPQVKSKSDQNMASSRVFREFNKWNAVDAAVEQHPYNFHNTSKSVPEFEALVAGGDITVGLLNLIGSLDKP